VPPRYFRDSEGLGSYYNGSQVDLQMGSLMDVQQIATEVAKRRRSEQDWQAKVA
jgi:hypothetical protein